MDSELVRIGKLEAGIDALKLRLEKSNSCHSPATGEFCSARGGGSSTTIPGYTGPKEGTPEHTKAVFSSLSRVMTTRLGPADAKEMYYHKRGQAITIGYHSAPQALWRPKNVGSMGFKDLPSAEGWLQRQGVRNIKAPKPVKPMVSVYD